MSYRTYHVESVFSSPDSVFEFHVDDDFRCPFPTEDLDEYIAEFVYSLICEASDQISELYGRGNHHYSLTSISFNFVGDSKE